MNPSAWRERIILAVLAGAGLCVSVYLGLYQLHVLGSVYDPSLRSAIEPCRVVLGLLQSLPVPDALLGAGNYAAEIVLDVLGGDDRWRGHPRLVAIFGVPLTVGALVSVALILMQAFVVGNFCALCLLSAGVSIVIFLVGLREVIAAARVLRARHTGHE